MFADPSDARCWKPVGSAETSIRATVTRGSGTSPIQRYDDTHLLGIKRVVIHPFGQDHQFPAKIADDLPQVPPRRLPA
jgi:hypothetical protein